MTWLTLHSPNKKNAKPALIQNEATLVINGPGFEKDAKYIFQPDMQTVGGYDKLDVMTKIGFSRAFMNKGTEYFTFGIDFELLSGGTLPIKPPTNEKMANVNITYQKMTEGGNSTLDVTMFAVSGSVTIDVYTNEYVKGSFKGQFETPDEKVYTAQCDFKIMKNL